MKQLKLPANLATVYGPYSLLNSGDTVQKQHLTDIDLSGLVYKNLHLKHCRLSDVSLLEANLSHLGMTSVQLKHCNLSAANLSESFWHLAEWQLVRASGLQVPASKLQDVNFASCKLDMSNFRFAELKDVTFSDCQLDETSFYQATLDNVKFENCSLTSAEFDDAKCNQVDLCGSDLTNITGLDSLAGSTIDAVQLIQLAPLMAQQLGLIIKN